MTKIIDQPVAKINPEDIERIISRDFSLDKIKGIMALLQWKTRDGACKYA
jgi:hypothetical protein